MITMVAYKDNREGEIMNFVGTKDAYEIYKEAYENISGLGRTVRGPSMSALPGKVSVEGITEINGEKVFVLTMLQARNPKWVKRPFFAKFDEN